MLGILILATVAAYVAAFVAFLVGFGFWACLGVLMVMGMATVFGLAAFTAFSASPEPDAQPA